MDFEKFFLCVDLLTIWYSGIIFHDLLNDCLEVYQDSRPPAPSTPKDNRRFGVFKPTKYLSWWRRLRLQKTFSRRLQNVLIKTNIFALVIRLQKTSSRRLDQDQYIRLGYTSSRRLQDVFKTSSRHLQDFLQKRLKDVFKTSSRHLAKISSRCFQDVSLS